jgi:hypothetical protein
VGGWVGGWVGGGFTLDRFRVKSISAGNTVSYFTSVGYQLYMAGITKKTGEANMFPKPFYDLQGWVPTQIACGNTCTAVVAGTDLITWGPSPTSGELAYGEHTKSSTRAKLVDDVHGCAVLSLACGAFATLVVIDPDFPDHVAPLAALPVYTPPAEPTDEAAGAAGTEGGTSRKEKKG